MSILKVANNFTNTRHFVQKVSVTKREFSMDQKYGKYNVLINFGRKCELRKRMYEKIYTFYSVSVSSMVTGTKNKII